MRTERHPGLRYQSLLPGVCRKSFVKSPKLSEISPTTTTTAPTPASWTVALGALVARAATSSEKAALPKLPLVWRLVPRSASASAPAPGAQSEEGGESHDAADADEDTEGDEDDDDDGGGGDGAGNGDGDGGGGGGVVDDGAEDEDVMVCCR